MNHAVLAMMLYASFSPYNLEKPPKVKHAKMIIEYAEQHGHDPYELLAIAITESSLNPKVVSWAGAIGLFQVMCKYWAKPLGYNSNKECSEALFQPKENIKAGVHVLTTYRKKYKQCKDNLAYRCYYAGPRWIYRSDRLKAKIIRYETKVLQRKQMLHKYYTKFIESVRLNYRQQS